MRLFERREYINKKIFGGVSYEISIVIIDYSVTNDWIVINIILEESNLFDICKRIHKRNLSEVLINSTKYRITEWANYDN